MGSTVLIVRNCRHAIVDVVLLDVQTRAGVCKLLDLLCGKLVWDFARLFMFFFVASMQTLAAWCMRVSLNLVSSSPNKQYFFFACSFTCPDAEDIYWASLDGDVAR